MPAAFARRSPAAVAAALSTVYVVWGSTYLAIRVADRTLPPLLMASARFLLAGAILYPLAARGGPRPTLREWRAAPGGGGGGVLLPHGGGPRGGRRGGWAGGRVGGAAGCSPPRGGAGRGGGGRPSSSAPSPGGRAGCPRGGRR